MKWFYRTMEIQRWLVFVLLGFIILCCFVVIMPRCPEPVGVYYDPFHVLPNGQELWYYMDSLRECCDAVDTIYDDQALLMGTDGHIISVPGWCADSIETLNMKIDSLEVEK